MNGTNQLRLFMYLRSAQEVALSPEAHLLLAREYICIYCRLYIHL